MKLTTQKLEQMRSVDIGAVAAESLPDVSGMMLRATADNRRDSEVDFHTIDSISFRIYLPGRNVYLTQNGLNQNLTWGSYAEQYIKAWVQVAA